MEAVGGLLSLLSMVAFVIGVVALIRPLPGLKLGSRRRAGGLLLGAFLLFFTALTLIGIAQPGNANADGAMKTQVSSPPGNSKKDDGPSPEAKAAFKEQVAVFYTVVKICDDANAPLARAIDSEDWYAAYDAAKSAQRACEESERKIGAIRFGEPIERTAQKALNDAISDCSAAYLGKAMTYEKVATAIDEPTRPSKMYDAKEWGERSKDQTLSCVVKFMGAAMKANLVSADEIGSH